LSKVTFCKRKGGLFKKASDLSLLCGCEVAVIILCENKTCQFASTDMERILTRYHQMNSGGAAAAQESETDKLWQAYETQRREIEGLHRQLAEERRKVEALVGPDMQMLSVPPTAVVNGLAVLESNDSDVQLSLQAGNGTAEQINSIPGGIEEPVPPNSVQVHSDGSQPPSVTPTSPMVLPTLEPVLHKPGQESLLDESMVASTEESGMDSGEPSAKRLRVDLAADEQKATPT